MKTTTPRPTYSPTLRTSTRKLPTNWRKIAGILHGRRKALEKHVATVRDEWK